MTLQVEVASAEQRVWSGEASRVIARTVDGDIGILTGHAPVLAILAPGEVQVLTSQGETVTATVQDGFISVEHDRVTIVAVDAVLGTGSDSHATAG
jgi:F-type H+-transporting ATPase subunit epsilon